ncbi:MAG: hypothetical protein GY847_01785 [Proteobacteria bacterium]|nr:hypothetical protein [Pseudomonadota bacterium]
MSILIEPPKDPDVEVAFLALLVESPWGDLAYYLHDAFSPPKGREKKDLNREFYHLLDLFGGVRTRFPSSTTVREMLRRAEIYVFLMKRNESSEAYRILMRQYGMTRGDIDRRHRATKETVKRHMKTLKARAKRKRKY